MDIKGLRYFIAAAERLNFTVAAKECYITQTAMSLHINKMETELGFRLFERNKRVVELTDAGRDFLGYAYTMVDDYTAAVQHSMNIAVGVDGVLSVILPGYMEGFIFMDRFKKFREEYPAVKLNLVVESQGRIVSFLKKKRVDIGIGLPYEMQADPDIQVITMREDPAIVLCSRNHPFASRGTPVKAGELEKETFVMTMYANTPNATSSIRKKWQRSGFSFNDYISVKNMDEMLLFIELGRGIGIFPAFVREYLGKLTLGIAEVDVAYRGKPPMTATAIGYMKENDNPVRDHFIGIFTGK
ncbi:MAG: LysR family transcriptional regulator [Clostridiales Family XIII bacterium]|jgi:DNA-binding transcriptional LysR family regulator|nr:LysR family transcriptional regulator [Clostridiales Family XIII bacterium]